MEEAATVSADPAGLVWEGPGHSWEGSRSTCLGRSGPGRILLIMYTVKRGPHDQEMICIIRARQAFREESRLAAAEAQHRQRTEIRLCAQARALGFQLVPAID